MGVGGEGVSHGMCVCVCLMTKLLITTDISGLLGTFCPLVLACRISLDMEESMCVPCCVPGWAVVLRTKLRVENNIQVCPRVFLFPFLAVGKAACRDQSSRVPSFTLLMWTVTLNH